MCCTSLGIQCNQLRFELLTVPSTFQTRVNAGRYALLIVLAIICEQQLAVELSKNNKF